MSEDKQSNPFAVQTTKQSGALAEVESNRAVAETQAAMVIAKKFPRDQVAAMDRILQSCSRPTLAEAALYEYSRGGTAITGPSIRMAEAMAQSWGNLQFGIRELEQVNGCSTVEAFAWDVETNTKQVKVFQVPHVRHTKKGSYRLEDPRDIYENVANQGARRLRACILGVIPGDVVDAAVRQCEVTLNTKAEVTPERIKGMLDKFAEFGVTRAQIEKRIQRSIDSITPTQLVDLGKKYNSIKDGMSSAADWFEVDPGNETDAKAAPVKGTAALKAKVAPKKQEQEPSVSDGGEVSEIERMKMRLMECQTSSECIECLDYVRTMVSEGTATDHDLVAFKIYTDDQIGFLNSQK